MPLLCSGNYPVVVDVDLRDHELAGDVPKAAVEDVIVGAKVDRTTPSLAPHFRSRITIANFHLPTNMNIEDWSYFQPNYLRTKISRLS